MTRSGSTITMGVVNNPTFSGTVTANGGLTVGASQTVNMGGNKVTNVAAGVASTDAVNKGQLDALNTIVTQNGTTTASGLGGGASYNSATGAVSAPSYTLANASTIAGTSGAATDVGSGFAKVDSALGTLNTQVTANTTNISNLQTTVNNISTGTAGLVQQSAAGANLTVGKGTDGAAVDFADKSGNARKLINVAAGSLSATSKDAVNGSQLYATNQQVAQNTTNIAGNTTAITNLDARVTTNEGNISTLNTNVSNIDARVTQNTTSITSLQGDVTNITTQINSGTVGLVQAEYGAWIADPSQVQPHIALLDGEPWV